MAFTTRPELRGTFGMVLQDTWLFSGTVRENIAFPLRAKRVKDAEVREKVTTIAELLDLSQRGDTLRVREADLLRDEPAG